jgi:hypothetical protein
MKQPLKYTAANIALYANYLLMIGDIPLERLHFLDESHFEVRRLHRKRAIGRIGKNIPVTGANVDLGLTFSLTLLTTLDPLASQPFAYSVREQSNTAC